MLKKLFLLVFLAVSLSIFANDVSNFINLGFSNNSKYFMFAEYGQIIDQDNLYVNTYIVDVEKNSFVQDGLNSAKYKYLTNVGNDNISAVFSIFLEKANIFNKYGIKNYNGGRVIYSLYSDELAKKILQYRDFLTEKIYDVELNQVVFGENSNVESSFFIDLKITNSAGKTESKTVGNPNIKRKNVEQYFVKQIIVAPNNKNLIFVVGKKINVAGKVSIRYMVETAVL